MAEDKDTTYAYTDEEVYNDWFPDKAEEPESEEVEVEEGGVDEVEVVEEDEVAEEPEPEVVDESDEDDDDAPAAPVRAPLPTSTNRKFKQMMSERDRRSRKYLGKKARY